MLLRATCSICLRPGGSPCPACEAALRDAPALPPPAGLDRCDALLGYDDGARALITGLKAANRRQPVTWMADRLASLRTPPVGAVVTWAPTSDPRARERGFDQAELLARALARRWRRPVRRLLRRRSGRAQAGRDRDARRAHPGFVVSGRVPRRVVVVDDVATTGATLTAAARALRAAGSVEVAGLVVARAA